MKGPRIISAGGCLAALLVAGCGGVSPNSMASPLGGSAQGAISLPSLTDDNCARGRISPKASTVKVNQRLYLQYEAEFRISYDCYPWQPEDAHWWTPSGGRVRPLHGGTEAIFRAVRPGVYPVRANWTGRIGRATVTVTSP